MEVLRFTDGERMSMRGPTREEILNTPPPALRMSSKTTQAYLEMRRKILIGEYAEDSLIIPKQMEDTYAINNTSTQMLLMRLANEGLVKVLPVRERAWPNNAALNEYRVADLTEAQKGLALRQHALLPTLHGDVQGPNKERLLLKIQYADAEIAFLLDIGEGEKVIVSRERERSAQERVTAISDFYVPFWFAEMLPELETPDADVYTLMRHMGKHPATCTETVNVVQAHSVERILFELSPDDPAPLLKVQRLTFDTEGHPLAVQFLTIRADQYRLQYSFSLAMPDDSKR